MDVLYIAGSGRSGSTLIERGLGQLDGVITVGELRHLWRRRPESELCGCGRVIAECPFWSDVLARVGIETTNASFEAIRSRQQEVDRIRHLPAMLRTRSRPNDYTLQAEEYTDLLARLYAAVLEVGNGRLIVDSSKDVSTLFLLSTMAEVQLRVLHLLRDSRAVAFSWMRQRVRPHVVDHVSYMPIYSPRKSAMDWNYRNLFSERVRGRVAGFRQMRYEDFVVQPAAQMAQLTQFAGLGQLNLDFIHDNELQLSRDGHTVSGNPMRFETGAVKLRLDDAWQTQLAPRDRRIVTGLTWPLLRKYGYV